MAQYAYKSRTPSLILGFRGFQSSSVFGDSCFFLDKKSLDTSQDSVTSKSVKSGKDKNISALAETLPAVNDDDNDEKDDSDDDNKDGNGSDDDDVNKDGKGSDDENDKNDEKNVVDSDEEDKSEEEKKEKESNSSSEEEEIKPNRQ